MIHSSCPSNCAWAFKYSSSGTTSPPVLNCIMSTECKGSRVSSAKRLASVDFPPPAFPNTATLLIEHARQHITATGSLWMTGAVSIIEPPCPRWPPIVSGRDRHGGPTPDVQPVCLHGKGSHIELLMAL